MTPRPLRLGSRRRRKLLVTLHKSPANAATNVLQSRRQINDSRGRHEHKQRCAEDQRQQSCRPEKPQGAGCGPDLISTVCQLWQCNSEAGDQVFAQKLRQGDGEAEANFACPGAEVVTAGVGVLCPTVVLVGAVLQAESSIIRLIAAAITALPLICFNM